MHGLFLEVQSFHLHIIKNLVNGKLLITDIKIYEIVPLGNVRDTKMKIEEEFGKIKRCGMHDDTPGWVSSIDTMMNIGSVIYMMIAGLILIIVNRVFLYFLAGFFMLIFSAIGPASGNSDLNFLLSVYGEILMMIFLFVFFKKYG